MKKKEIIKILKKNHLMPQAYRVDLLLNILHKETPGIQGSLMTYVNADEWDSYGGREFVIDVVTHNQNYAIEKIKEMRKRNNNL